MIADGSPEAPLSPEKQTADEGGYDVRSRMAEQNQSIDSKPSELLVFYTITVLQFIFGFVLIIILGIWLSHYRGGFAWDGSGKEFNYHPLFMTIGLVFLYGNGIIIYRVLRQQSKPTVKLIHFGCHTFSFVFAVLGLIAAFDFHNANTIPNLYTLHSWIGLTTVCLFACQLLFGFCGFLYPTFSDRAKEIYLSVHVYFGLAIFALAIMASLTGITEKLFFVIPETYPKYTGEGILMNIYGVFLVIFAGLILFIATKVSYKRLPDNAEYSPIQ